MRLMLQRAHSSGMKAVPGALAGEGELLPRGAWLCTTTNSGLPGELSSRSRTLREGKSASCLMLRAGGSRLWPGPCGCMRRKLLRA